MNGNESSKAAPCGERSRVVIVADDYQFLETLHGSSPALAYEWLLAGTREQLLGFAKSAPLVFVVDLQMQSMDYVGVLELIGALGSRAKIVFLSGTDMRVLARAKSLAAALSLDVIGSLMRPLAMNKLVDLLIPHSRKVKEIEPGELEQAFAQGQFLLHYQPIIRREDSGWAVRGAEALVRWKHPDRGLLYPGQFLRATEDSGLMGQLTDFVMLEAIRQASEWEHRGLDLAVAFNLAPTALHDVGFLDRLSSATRRFRLSPGRITIETVEAVPLKDREVLGGLLARLQTHGIGLSLDDFGSGYSSFTQVDRLPFTELKIDRKLIADVPQSREAAAAVQDIIDMAHRLSIQVCAEGVETTEAFMFLEDAGCDAVQGVLIGKPADAADVEKLMLRWGNHAQQPRAAAG